MNTQAVPGVSRVLSGCGRWWFWLMGLSLPLSLFGMQAAAILGGVSVCAALALCPGRRWLGSPLDGAFGLLLAAIALSLLLAPRPPSSFQSATSCWVWVTFFAAYRFSEDVGLLRRVVAACICLACGVALLGVVESLTGWYPLAAVLHPQAGALPPPMQGRPGWFGAVGLFHSRLTLAHVLLFPFCWSVALGLEAAGARMRILCSLAACTLAVGIGFTFTRAAPIAAAIAGAGLVVWRVPAGWPRRAGALLFAVAFGLGAWLVLFHGEGRLGGSFAGRHDWGRLAVWQSAVELTAERPLTGIGYGNFQRDALVLVERRSREAGATRFPGTVAWAHSNPLTFLVECGLLGVFAWILVFVGYFRSMWRGWRQGVRGGPRWRRAWLKGSLAAVGAFSIVGLFHDNFFDGEVAFALFFTLGASLAALRWPPPEEGA